MTAKRVYFFRGDKYARFDSAPNAVPSGYPRSIATWWGGLPDDLDAAFNRGKGRTYFFKGNQYYRYTVVRDAVDPGYPKSIAAEWPGMSDAGFDSAIDAAVNWADGKVYFFKGGQYVRYDLAADKVDPGYPRPIAGNWKGVAGTGFENGIDAAINYGNGKAYFFKGDQYLRLDVAAKEVDLGYPLSIGTWWPGMAAAGFGSGIGAALEWPHAELTPTGFRVPTGRSGCGVTPVAGGNRGGEQFRMELDFHEPAYPAACAVGEYRQFVRGTIVINGTTISFGMPNATPGRPAVTLLPRPAPGAASDNFQEDGILSANLGGGGDFFYGRRLETRGFATDVYQSPDRMTGCEFRGFDSPGFGPHVAGDTFAFDIDFQGQAYDRANSEVLRFADWNFNCSGTL